MVGIYVRVSTEEQACNGFSIRAQIDKLTSFCKLKEWDVFDVYKDEGISGKSINERSGLLRLIEDIKNKNIDNVLVYKIDRLTRSTKDLIELVELFNKYNCSFNSFTECIDTKSSTGRMFIKIIGIFAEFERENIVERVKMGLERKVREGYSIASHNISYGYEKKRGSKLQEINQYEAYIVRKIFNMYLDGNTFTFISKYLNKFNVKTKLGNCWTSKNIKLVLSNPNYVGKVRYGLNKSNYFEIDGRHNKIIDYSLFDKVNNKLSKKRTNIFCKCGNKMIIKCSKYYSLKRHDFVKYRKLYCSSCKRCLSLSKFDSYMEYIVLDWGKMNYKGKYDYVMNNKVII